MRRASETHPAARGTRPREEKRKGGVLRRKSATKAKADYSLEVRKRIPASREEVFDAWLNPKSVEQWMHGGPTMSCRAKIDPRIGGSFKIDMIAKEKTYEHSGVYKRIERPKLLEFTWISEGTNQQESVVTIEFLDRAREPELLLKHRLLPSQGAAN